MVLLLFTILGECSRTVKVLFIKSFPALKSKYCTNAAPEVFRDLIKNITANYIVVSYNNMEKKGNDRSNTCISDMDLLHVLETKGEVKVFSEQFKAFTTETSK